jgi:hypothetical protein
MVSDAELDAAMFEMDDDDSGTVAFIEFFRWWKRRIQREQEALHCWALADDLVPRTEEDEAESSPSPRGRITSSNATAAAGAGLRSRSTRGATASSKNANLMMDELGISSENIGGTRTAKKGNKKVRRMSVVAIAEDELAQEGAAWTVSSAVAGGKTDEARDAQAALKREEARVRRQRRVASLSCGGCCATSDRKKAHQRAKHDPRAQCRKLFDQVDDDGSGLLDIDEIPKLAALLGLRLTPEQKEAAMQEMDADGSGEVDFEEFWKWWQETGGADDNSAVKHEDTALGKATRGWAQAAQLRVAASDQQKRSKNLKHIANRPGMSVDDMKKMHAGKQKVHSSSVWLKADDKSGVTMWGRKSTGPVGTLGNWETAIETRPQQWQTMSLWMHESDHAFIE